MNDDQETRSRRQQGPTLYPFLIVWRDGKQELASGKDIADAFRRAGIGGGAHAAVDYYKELKDYHVFTYNRNLPNSAVYLHSESPGVPNIALLAMTRPPTWEDSEDWVDVFLPDPSITEEFMYKKLAEHFGIEVNKLLLIKRKP